MLPLLAVVFASCWWAYEDPTARAMVMWVISALSAAVVCLTWLGMLMILVHLFDRGFKMAAKKKGR